ncbi:MAG: rhodanese-like domain-containing protein [Pseudomonadota bacterium]
MRLARILPVLALSLCVCACAPENDVEDYTPGLTPGFELASYGDQAAEQQNASEPRVVALDAGTFAELIARPDIRVIDVRTAQEVAEGVIQGAEHIPLAEFNPAALDLSDGRGVVLYCRSGRRSGIAATKLSEHLGVPVAHLDGGILAWQEAGFALTRP